MFSLYDLSYLVQSSVSIPDHVLTNNDLMYTYLHLLLVFSLLYRYDILFVDVLCVFNQEMSWILPFLHFSFLNQQYSNVMFTLRAAEKIPIVILFKACCWDWPSPLDDAGSVLLLCLLTSSPRSLCPGVNSQDFEGKYLGNDCWSVALKMCVLKRGF